MANLKDRLGRGEGRKPGWTYLYQSTLVDLVLGTVILATGHLYGLVVLGVAIPLALFTYRRYRDRGRNLLVGAGRPARTARDV